MNSLFSKITVSVVVVLLSLITWGQDPVVNLKGQTTNASGQKLGGVTVAVKRGGTVVQSVTTASNGKFSKLEFPCGYVYEVVFSKSGYVSKTIKINTEDNYFPEEMFEQYPFDMPIGMVEAKPDVDYSPITSKPIGLIEIGPSYCLLYTSDAADD